MAKPNAPPKFTTSRFHAFHLTGHTEPAGAAEKPFIESTTANTTCVDPPTITPYTVAHILLLSDLISNNLVS